MTKAELISRLIGLPDSAQIYVCARPEDASIPDEGTLYAIAEINRIGLAKDGTSDDTAFYSIELDMES